MHISPGPAQPDQPGTSQPDQTGTLQPDLPGTSASVTDYGSDEHESVPATSPIKSHAAFSSSSLAQESTSGVENIYDPEKAAHDIMGMAESEEDEGATFRMKAMSQSKKSSTLNQNFESGAIVAAHKGKIIPCWFPGMVKEKVSKVRF